MFHVIPERIERRMLELEQRDAAQRTELSLPKDQRLLAVSPEGGRWLAFLAAQSPAGSLLVEVGTGSGYSTLWLALACLGTDRRIRTFEKIEHRLDWATETIRVAGLEECVELVSGDALELLDSVRGAGFCFIDAEKAEYLAYYEKLIPRMLSGGILVADNVLSHAEIVAPFLERVRGDTRVDALGPLPVGKGLLVCRKI